MEQPTSEELILILRGKKICQIVFKELGISSPPLEPTEEFLNTYKLLFDKYKNLSDEELDSLLL